MKRCLMPLEVMIGVIEEFVKVNVSGLVAGDTYIAELDSEPSISYHLRPLQRVHQRYECTNFLCSSYSDNTARVVKMFQSPDKRSFVNML
mgnify:CR=1 FL=1